MTTFLLLLFLQQPQIDQQLQRQQQQLQQMQQDLRDQEAQLRRLVELMERRQQEQRQRPICSVDLRWVNEAETRTTPRTATALVSLNLFSTISEPAGDCLPGEVRITASYLDANDNLVCSGAVENIAVQSTLTQSINFDVRPWDLNQFVRWRNEPPHVNSGFKRLSCLNPEGTAEASPGELERIAWMRIRATVFPRGAGISTAEMRISLAKPAAKEKN